MFQDLIALALLDRDLRVHDTAPMPAMRPMAVTQAAKAPAPGARVAAIVIDSYLHLRKAATHARQEAVIKAARRGRGVC